MPGTPGGASATTEEGAVGSVGGGGVPSRRGSSGTLLLPAGAFTRSSSSGLLGSPSGWETPLGMGPGGAEGPGMGPGSYISPESQVCTRVGAGDQVERACVQSL